MHTRPRRLLSLLALALIAVACGPGGGTSAPTGTNIPTAAPVASATPVAASDGPASAAPSTGQTDTDWGRIWDAVPPGFPTYPGSTPAEDAGIDGVSAVWALEGGDPAEIASWFQAALEGATYSTDALSGPLEDESFLLESVGAGDCRIAVQVTPTGGLTLVTVKYGAACPNA
ncbi:MAG TPA: hypothetical protein VD763_12905 [Candidatus Saccharimonadales bacterium]|nr:hypothetical protein [Candidatus Saccharimonadales bacterium]